MDLRELIQQFHHAVVVFERVEPDPGEAILARDHVFVERLVHVPEKHQPDLRGTGMTHSGSLSRPSVSGRWAGLKLVDQNPFLPFARRIIDDEAAVWLNADRLNPEVIPTAEVWEQRAISYRSSSFLVNISKHNRGRWLRR